MALTMQQMKAQFQDKKRAGIVDLLWQSSPLLQRLFFIEHNGFAYPYTQRSKLPGVAFRALNEQFTATAGVTNPAIETLSILGGKIKTDGLIIDVKGPQARTNEIAAQMESAGKFFDKNFIKGDPTTNPRAFYGLEKRLSGSQLLTNATNGDVPNHEMFVKLLDAVEGPNNEKLLLMNRTVRRDLSHDVGADAGGRNVMDVTKQLTEFEGCPIVEIFKDETETDILPFTETCGSSNVCTSAYCIRLGKNVDERGVQAISGLKEHIKASGPYDYGEYQEDIVQMVAGIGLFGGYVAARLQGLKAA